MWTFTLPCPTPSLNEIQSQHWTFKVEAKKALGWRLASSLNKIKRIPNAKGKRRLTIIRHGKGRLDRDNLVGGCKWLVDAIKDRGLLLDDDEASVELVVSQVVSRKDGAHTVIYLEDCA